MREANPDCVTVLLTAYPAFETAVRSIRAEVDDYFRNLCQKIRFKRPIRSIYAAASGFVGSCSSALKPNLASSSARFVRFAPYGEYESTEPFPTSAFPATTEHQAWNSQ